MCKSVARTVLALEVLGNRAVQIDVYLLTYSLTTPCIWRRLALVTLAFDGAENPVHAVRCLDSSL